MEEYKRGLTVEEIISAFPEGVEVLTIKIQEWTAEKENITEQIRDQIRQYRDNPDYWLVRSMMAEFMVPKIKEADRHIARLKMLMKAYQGKLPTNIITEADIASAKQYDFKWLYEETGGKLRRVGRNYIGLCPFHEEKNPSFQIYTKSNSFYCFGCNRGGDAIAFVRKWFGFSFGGAIDYINGK